MRELVRLCDRISVTKETTEALGTHEDLCIPDRSNTSIPAEVVNYTELLLLEIEGSFGAKSIWPNLRNNFPEHLKSIGSAQIATTALLRYFHEAELIEPSDEGRHRWTLCSGRLRGVLEEAKIIQFPGRFITPEDEDQRSILEQVAYRHPSLELEPGSVMDSVYHVLSGSKGMGHNALCESLSGHNSYNQINIAIGKLEEIGLISSRGGVFSTTSPD